MSLPLLILRGVKSKEEVPRGASSLERCPFPGRDDSDVGSGCADGGALRIDPILVQK